MSLCGGVRPSGAAVVGAVVGVVVGGGEFGVAIDVAVVAVAAALVVLKCACCSRCSIAIGHAVLDVVAVVVRAVPGQTNRMTKLIRAAAHKPPANHNHRAGQRCIVRL